MHHRSYLFMAAAVLGLAACGGGIDNPSGQEAGTAGAGGAAGASTAVDPDSAETPTSEAQKDARQPDAEDIASDASGGSLTVTPEAYEALLAAGDGTNLSDLPDVPGMSDFVSGMTAALPVTGAPNAMCADVTVPVDASGCAELYPGLVDGGSYDTDTTSGDQLPLNGLEGSLDTYQACGTGAHHVALTVTDQDGSFSSCTSTVTLCDPVTDADCPAQPIKSPGTIDIAARPALAMTCKWVHPAKFSPAAQKKLTLSNYSYQEKGPGPRYWRTSKDFEKRSCLNPPDHEESFSETLDGDVDFDVNVVCFDAAGNQVRAPQCKSDVELRAFYRSQVHADSEDGLACGGNAVEAYAQDEIRFVANNKPIFNKAVIVQNGTEASTSVTFSLGGKVGTSTAGLSAEASVGFGWTRNFTDKTANKTDFLFADGYAKQPTPVTARLQGRGRTYLKIHDRTWGSADIRTGQWLAMYVGSSQCPGAGPIAHGSRRYYTNVLPAENEQDVAAANNFLKARGFNLQFKK